MILFMAAGIVPIAGSLQAYESIGFISIIDGADSAGLKINCSTNRPLF
jgi:hypothetical protein